MMSLLRNSKINNVLGPVAAGQTLQKTNGVDCANLDTVLFILSVGSITSGAALSVKLQGSDTDVDAAYVDLAGTSQAIPDTESNKLVCQEIIRPQHRYVRQVITRATQNVALNGCVAVATTFVRNVPVTQASTQVSASSNLSAVSPEPA